MPTPVALRPLSPAEEALQLSILRVLAQHPAGLTPGEIASQLALPTSLTRVLHAMATTGRVRRVAPEMYAVQPASNGTPR